MKKNEAADLSGLNTISEIEIEENKTHSTRDISIWIDGYDDIFSDFDPRSFSERTISDDFLYELKKVCRENDFPINEFKLLVPDKSRDKENEALIIKRLHTYFRKNHHHFRTELKRENKKGIGFTLAGMTMMVCATYISSLKSENILMHILLVILEPTGWFFVWTGLDDLLKQSRQEKPQLDFFNKMIKSKIVFQSI